MMLFWFHVTSFKGLATQRQTSHYAIMLINSDLYVTHCTYMYILSH